MSMRKFLNLEPGVGISKTAIQSNLKAVSDETWEQLSKKTTEYAKCKELEDGKVVRGDCTAVETNIHYPTANRDLAKEMGVENLTFSKNGSMDIGSLMDTPKLHRALRNFRAGVEGCISFLKRCFGFSRVLDKTLETFKAALHLGAAAYNLTLLARMHRGALQS